MYLIHKKYGVTKLVATAHRTGLARPSRNPTPRSARPRLCWEPRGLLAPPGLASAGSRENSSLCQASTLLGAERAPL